MTQSLSRFFAVLAILSLSILTVACDSGQQTAATDGSDTSAITASPSVSLVAPLGDGDGKIAYENLEGVGGDPWGPASFCVLSDGSVAILDGVDQSIEVFDSSGSFVRSVTLDAAVRYMVPEDIRSWKDGHALLVMNDYSTYSVVIVDANGALIEQIDLPEDWYPSSLLVTSDGTLAVAEFDSPALPVTDPEGAPLSIAQIRSTAAAQGTVQPPSAPDVSTELAGPPELLGQDGSGNSYFYAVPSYGPDTPPGTLKKLVLRAGPDSQLTGIAEIPFADYTVFPNRLFDVTLDDIYAMVPMEDGVLVKTLVFSTDLP